MTIKDSTITVKRLARKIGFHLVKVASSELIPEAREHYKAWLAKGYHGEMAYLERDVDRRTDPALVVANAKSVIMLALNYYQEDTAVPAIALAKAGRVAKYARGKDYHKVTEEMHQELLIHLRNEFPDEEFRSYVDYGPFMERAYAEKAGIGFVGKNGNIISKEYGSWILLSEIITTLELEPDQPLKEVAQSKALRSFDGLSSQDGAHSSGCGSCTKCIDACPTGAIIDPYTVDARKCIAYLTIEQKGEIPANLGVQMGNRFFGCDICQDVCPWNMIRSHETDVPEFKEASSTGSRQGVGEWVDLEKVESMREEEFADFAKDTPLKRPKLCGNQRNARVVIQNTLDQG